MVTLHSTACCRLSRVPAVASRCLCARLGWSRHRVVRPRFEVSDVDGSFVDHGAFMQWFSDYFTALKLLHH